MKKARKMVSIIVTLCFLLTLVPAGAFAAPKDTETPFDDVQKTDWFYDTVQYVYDEGLMAGTGDRIFSPQQTTTRGMIVTILHRMAGSPEAEAQDFTDVDPDAWYTPAINWSIESGVGAGYGGGLFGPDDAITREQMASFLYRYAELKEYDVSAVGDLDDFADASAVSDWAEDVMSWAVGAELFAGRDNNQLAPQGLTTRAEAATILMRYCENIVGTSANEPSDDSDKPAVEPGDPNDEGSLDNPTIGDSAVSFDNFSADETSFAVGEDVAITFTVDIDGSPKSVVLYNDNEQVGMFHDDGKNGDSKAKDGVYSYIVHTKCSTETIENYKAVIDGETSPIISIYFFDQPSSNEEQAANYVEQKVAEIESTYSDDNGHISKNNAEKVLSEVAAYAKELYSKGELLSYETSDSAVAMKFQSGLNYVFSPKIDGLDSAGANTDMTVMTVQPFAQSYSSDLNEYMTYPDQVATKSAKTFINYTFNQDDNLDENEVTLERIKDFSSNQIILWHGHGGYTKNHHSFLVTGEEYSSQKHWKDNVAGRILKSSNGRACVTSKFIDEYCGNMNNTVVYLASCETGRDDVLANAILSKGADAVVASSKSILTTYDLDVLRSTVMYMMTVDKESRQYYSLKDALEHAERIYGANDSIRGGDGAEMLIFGGSEAENYRLREEKAGIIQGRVVDNETSEPIKNVEVSLVYSKTDDNVEADGTIITDNDGSYYIVIPDNAVQVSGIKFVRSGYEPRQLPLDADRFLTVEIADVKLQPTDSSLTEISPVFTGTVKDKSTGAPLENVNIYVYDKEGYGPYFSDQTDKNGEFHIKLKTSGIYNLKFQKEGYADIEKKGVQMVVQGEYSLGEILMSGQSSEVNPFAGGSGTEEDPYQVATAEQLNAVRDHLDSHFVQTADISLAEYENWEPIGTNQGKFSNKNAMFSGSYDGNGKTISNMNIALGDISGNYRLGLFGQSEGKLCNINLENINIAVDGRYSSLGNSENKLYVGSIVAYAEGDNPIENCHVLSGSINSGGHGLGGIVGYATVPVEFSSNKAKIVSSGVSGGIAGYSSNTVKDCINYATGTMDAGIVAQCKNVDRCINYGDINGGSAGIVGTISREGPNVGNGKVTFCVNYGDITKKYIADSVYGFAVLNVGGIAGYAAGNDSVENCINYGNLNVSSKSLSMDPRDGICTVGGILGKVYYLASSKVKIENCFNYANNIEAYEDHPFSSDPDYEYLPGYTPGVLPGEIARICPQSNFEFKEFNNVYSVDTNLNGEKVENTGTDSPNGETLTKRQMDEKSQYILTALKIN